MFPESGFVPVVYFCKATMRTDLHHNAYPGIGSTAIVVIAAAALSAGFAFILFLPGPRAKITLLFAHPVSVSASQRPAPSSPTPSVIARQGPRSVSLLAQVFGLPDKSGDQSVVFDTNIPVAPTETLDPFLSSDPRAAPSVAAPRLAHTIFISEISIADASSVRHEFVELYNPNGYAVDLAGWELRKKTQSGTDSVLVSSGKFSGTISADGYFLVAHPEYAGLINADLSWSGAGYGMSENGTVYLADDQGTIIDLVGYGQSISYEGAAAQNPGEQASIARITRIDTGNNAADFVLTLVSPRASGAGTGFVIPIPFVQPTISPVPSPVQSFLPSPPQIFSPSPVASVSVVPSPTPTFAPTLSPIPSAQPSTPPTPVVVHPAIIVVQFGIDGNANADFVQMRNVSVEPLDLSSYKLVKKTASSGAEYSLKSWKNDQQSIPAGADFYWINSGYAEKLQELSSQGIAAFATSATIAPTNGIALKYQDQVVSGVQW